MKERMNFLRRALCIVVSAAMLFSDAGITALAAEENFSMEKSSVVAESGSEKSGTVESGVAEETASKETASEETASTRETTAEETAADETTAKESAAEETASKETGAEEATTGGTATEEDTTGEPVAEETGTEEILEMMLEAEAGDNIASDVYTRNGSAISWKISADGVLTVEGRGNFALPGENAPWYAYASQIKSAEIKITEITSLRNMFKDCTSLTTVNFGGFDVGVADMRSMFEGCTGLTSLDFLSNLNTSNAADMHSMFEGCTGLKEVNLSFFDTTSATDMSNMFRGCTNLELLDLRSWKNKNVVSMSSMFANCKNLKTLTLERFETGSVADMGNMFYNCQSLEHLDLGSFRTENVSAMGAMFKGCTKLKSLDLGGFRSNKAAFMSEMFYDCGSLEYLDLSEFRTDKAETMWGMFYNCGSLKSLDLSSFRTGGVANMGSMFYNCVSLETLDVSNFDTAKVETMWGMFYNCKNLTQLNLRSFKTGSVANMGNMFYNCVSLTSLDLSSFNPDNVTDMSSMFSGCRNLEYVGLSGFSTGSVTNLESMFYNCVGLTSLDLGSFKTGNVTNMGNMFYNCGELKNLDLSSFKTGSVTNMGNMFYNCVSLAGLTVNKSTFDTSRVEIMDSMFYNCGKLASLDVGGFDTGSVRSMGSMFYNCVNLKSLDLSGFKTSNVTNMSSMFSGCESLETLDVKSFSTGNVTNMYNMFYKCRLLTYLDLSGFDAGNVTSAWGIIHECTSLARVDTPKNVKISIPLPPTSKDQFWVKGGEKYSEFPQNRMNSVTLELSPPTKKPASIKVEMTKTTYNKDDKITLDELTVTYTYTYTQYAGTDKEREVTETVHVKPDTGDKDGYTTNLSDINTSTPGEKILTVTYVTPEGVTLTDNIKLFIVQGEYIKPSKTKLVCDKNKEVNLDIVLEVAYFDAEGRETIIAKKTDNVNGYTTTPEKIDTSVIGEQTLVIKYVTPNGVTLQTEVEILIRPASYIDAKKETTKYAGNEKITLDDLTVYYHYYTENGEAKSEKISAKTDQSDGYTTNLKDIDMSTLGTKSLIVTYETEQGETLKSLIKLTINFASCIKAKKTKMTYVKNEEIKLDDIIVTYYYKENEEEKTKIIYITKVKQDKLYEVTTGTTVTIDKLTETPGLKTLTIKYFPDSENVSKFLTDEIEILVKPDYITADMPNKEYSRKEKINLNDLKVTYYSEDNKNKQIYEKKTDDDDGYTTNVNEINTLAAGEKTLKITYVTPEGLTLTGEIKLTVKNNSYIMAKMEKTAYAKDDVINPKDLTVTYVYPAKDKEDKEIDKIEVINNYTTNWGSIDKSKSGKKTLIITYITPIGTTLTDEAEIFIKGNVNITTAGHQGYFYSGSPIPAYSGTITATADDGTDITENVKELFEYTYEGTEGTSYDKTGQPPTDAGSYRMVVSIDKEGYTGTAAECLFTIKKASITIRAKNMSLETGAPVPKPEDYDYDIFGPAAKEYFSAKPKFTCGIRSTAKERTYDITVSDAVLDPKYANNFEPEITYLKGRLYVVKGDDENDSPVKDDSPYEDNERTELSSEALGTEITLKKTKVTYSGKPHEPTVKVTVKDANDKKGKKRLTLIEGIDYSVIHDSNPDAGGEHSVTIVGNGIYIGEMKSGNFEIAPKPINSLKVITGGITTDTDTTDMSKLPVSIYDGAKKLTYGMDYTLSDYKPSRTSARITIKGSGNYTREVKKTITLYNVSADKLILPEHVILNETERTYTGKPINDISLDVMNPGGSGEKLAKGTDYTVSFQNNTNAGTAFAVITGKGQYKGKVIKEFTINPVEKTPCTVTVSQNPYYNGKYQKPAVTVTFPDGKRLVRDRDYTVTYVNNRHASVNRTAKAVIRGIGNYAYISGEGLFTIYRQGIAKAKVTGTKEALKITYGGRELVKGYDYKIVSYSSPDKKGRMKVTIEGIGDFAGTTIATVKAQ